jgi:S1-C subfamily serine protease
MFSYRRWIELLCLALVALVFGRSKGVAGEEIRSQASKSPAAQEQSQTASAPVEASDAVANAVVKVFSTIRLPDPYKPWTKRSPTEVTGSGVVLSGKRILSNAHMVLYASQVQIQANQSGDKIPARVEAVAPGIDLAVLKLEDESFFDTHKPLAMSETLPEIKDAVMAYGYPEGGTSLSITKGIVSRIEFALYSMPVSGLRIQIDAAINPGNSGGPAVAGDKMIGLAFSSLRRAQNIGYIIPCEEIQLFLKDIEDGKYDGKPAMFDDFQTLENPALRNFLKLDKSVEGMVVHKPFSSDASYPLKEWDVVTKIGDTPVDDQGMIKVGRNLRLRFTYMVQKIATDGKLPLTVVREGKALKVELPVMATKPDVIPDLNGAYPSFFIYGPMVFSSATKTFVLPLLEAGGSSMANYLAFLIAGGSPLLSRMGQKPDFEGEELVVVPSPFFPHKLSRGYSEPFPQVVKSVNNVPIRNLGHLVQFLRDSKAEFLTFAFDTRFAETIVFPRAEMAAATEEILTDNGIRAQGSPDTMAIWNEKR